MDLIVHIYALQGDGQAAPNPIVTLTLDDVLPETFDPTQIGRLRAEVSVQSGSPNVATVIAADLHANGGGQADIERDGDATERHINIDPAPVGE